MSNLYWITSDEFEVAFQATYPIGETPNIICKNNLRQNGMTTKVTRTTTAAPVTTSKAPVTTSEVAVKTTKVPLTTGKSENATKGQMTTTIAPSTSVIYEGIV